jgi:hypothetical protein
MRRMRIKNAIKKYMEEHRRFSFASIYESLNKSRTTNVTTAQLGSLLNGTKGLSRVTGPRIARDGYEDSIWEAQEND